MILVVGSTGRLGIEICRILAVRGVPMRALIRRTSAPLVVEQLKNYGAELILGDLRDGGSLTEACRGVSGVICAATAYSTYAPSENDFQTVDLDGVTNLVEAAKRAIVPHFIYISFSTSVDIDTQLCGAKRSVEKLLQESGMVYTILRPAFFMETWFTLAFDFDPLAGKVMIYGDGINPVGWISVRDVARFAVHSLSNPLTYDAILELGGPQLLSPRQVIRIFEEAAHQTFMVKIISERILNQQFMASKDAYQRSRFGLLLCYAHGDNDEMLHFPKIFPNQLISVHNYSESVFALTRQTMAFHLPEKV